MARYVLLSFDDNGEAERFVAAFRGGSVFFSHTNDDGTGVYGYNDSTKSKVHALYMKPTQFCTCATEGKWKRTEGFSKGRKYGLWVHTCGKPSRLAWDETEIARKLGLFGHNLLSEPNRQSDTA